MTCSSLDAISCNGVWGAEVLDIFHYVCNSLMFVVKQKQSASVPKLNLNDVFEQKTGIAEAMEDELEKAMSTYGYKIGQTLIVDIKPDEQVKRAMNEINAAARIRVAAIEKAEADKILQIKQAESDAESKQLAGSSMAQQWQAIVDRLRNSILAFSGNVPGTTANDVLGMMLISQYFDTMKEIASQIRDGVLQANTTQ